MAFDTAFSLKRKAVLFFMKIGTVEIKGIAALAPMAGVTDRAFRELSAQFGACYVVSEMVSAKGILYENQRTIKLLEQPPLSCPFAVQLFGDDPKIMAQAAKRVLVEGPDIIDINMGCPAPKISSNGCGAALMKDPKRCGKIVRAVKEAVDIPVTVKIRKGWDNSLINAVEVAKICQDAGADAIAVHGRTREEMYAPFADWEIIRQVKRAVDIPVIGNGDVTDEKAAAKLLEDSGCDLLMVGRAALGNPWIFSKINAYMNFDRVFPDPMIAERINVMIRHVQLLCQYKGEKHGMREARKHVGWYLKGLSGAAAFRKEAGNLKTFEELLELSNRIYEKNRNIHAE